MVVHMDASQPGARSAAVNLCMYRCEGMARIASKERAGVYIPIGERWWWRGRTQMKAETAEAEPTSKTIRRPGQGRARQQPPGERRGRAAREASVSCPFLLLLLPFSLFSLRFSIHPFPSHGRIVLDPIRFRPRRRTRLEGREK